jgi:hypothetical protein
MQQILFSANSSIQNWLTLYLAMRQLGAPHERRAYDDTARGQVDPCS